MAGPYNAGTEVFHAVYDPRGGTVFTAVNHMIWGPQVQKSSDLGESWVSAAQSPMFAGESGRTVSQLWQSTEATAAAAVGPTSPATSRPGSASFWA